MGFCCSCCSASHDLPYAKPSRTPPDAELFPRYFQNKQGLWLHFAEWAPPRDVPSVRAVLFIISGLGEHTARYDGTAMKFAEAGFHVFCMDNQGAGGSEGRRQYVENFYDFVDDFQLFKKRMFARYPEYATLPCFLLGHSMGGLIAVHVAMRDFSAVDVPPAHVGEAADPAVQPWTGVVLSGPALEVDPALGTPFLRWVSRCLSSCSPKLGLQKLDARLISTNIPIVEFALQDPFLGRARLTARWGAEMLRAMDDVWKNIEKSTFPFLIVHGTDDRLCTINGSRRFVEAAVSQDKRLVEYPGFYHEVLNEVRWKEVLMEVMEFMNRRCPS